MGLGTTFLSPFPQLHLLLTQFAEINNHESKHSCGLGFFHKKTFLLVADVEKLKIISIFATRESDYLLLIPIISPRKSPLLDFVLSFVRNSIINPIELK